LGPHSRRFIYFYILDDKDIMCGSFAKNVPRIESSVFRLGFPGAKRVIRRALNVTADGFERSKDKIDKVMSDVSERLADGRKYLTGARFTVADLTFAALAAPLVVPPEYGWPMPAPHHL